MNALGILALLVYTFGAYAYGAVLLLLSEVADVEVVGEAEDGERAMEQIAALTPTVMFLDIQMPGCSGLEVAAALPAPPPHVIFCTAFDQYAIDAFELNAVDYRSSP